MHINYYLKIEFGKLVHRGDVGRRRLQRRTLLQPRQSLRLRLADTQRIRPGLVEPGRFGVIASEDKSARVKEEIGH